MTGSGEPRVLAGVWVAGNFFHMLGIQPQLGRLFTPEETVKGGRPAVLLSYPFWQRQFAGNPAIVGQAITLNNQAVTVVGVLPASFDFGGVFHPGVKADIFTPVIMDDIRTWGHMLSIIGLLKPGVTVAQAQAEADVVYPQMRAAHPDWMTDLTIKITGLKDHVSGTAAPLPHRAVVCCRSHSAHRLRQSLQPVAGSRRRAQQGVRHAQCSGSGRGPD